MVSLNLISSIFRACFQIQAPYGSLESSRGWKISDGSIFLILTRLQFIHPRGFEAIRRAFEFENRLKDIKALRSVQKQWHHDTKFRLRLILYCGHSSRLIPAL